MAVPDRGSDGPASIGPERLSFPPRELSLFQLRNIVACVRWMGACFDHGRSSPDSMAVDSDFSVAVCGISVCLSAACTL